jgi:hypothetical protein
MNEEIAALRHRAFAVKLALRRVATFYNELKRARLSAQVPGLVLASGTAPQCCSTSFRTCILAWRPRCSRDG